MRYFTEIIHMGNGKESEKLCKLLIKRLKKALSLQSALQQGIGHAPDTELDKIKSEIIDIVEDIKIALDVK